MTADFSRLRAQIPALSKLVYLNTGWSGPSPQPVVDAIKAQLDFENQGGPTAPPVLEVRRRLSQEARQAAATVLGASPEEIALTQNTTQGLNFVLNGFPWRPGDEILTCNLEHSSILVPAHYLRQRYGVETRIVELEAQDPAEAIVNKLEAAMGPRTRLVALSHISYSTATKLPAQAIQEMAHRHGALVLWDAAQSAGQMRLNAPEMGLDFYAFPAHKWLLGPDGVGGLFIRNDLIPEITPPEVSGWGAKSYDLRGGFEPERESMHKFETTTTSGPLLAGFVTVVKMLGDLGWDAIEARVVALAQGLWNRLAEIPGVDVVSTRRPDTASGLVAISIKDCEPAAVVTHLWESHRIVARSLSWPSAVRLSLAPFTTEAELDLVAEVAAQLSQSGIPNKEVAT